MVDVTFAVPSSATTDTVETVELSFVASSATTETVEIATAAKREKKVEVFIVEARLDADGERLLW